MIKGTRILMGEEALKYTQAIESLRSYLRKSGYEEIVLPNLWEQKTFIEKSGVEGIAQMYTFKDKGDRDICLIPEATALIQEMYNQSWSKSKPKPMKLFYVQRCYRYDRPQAGRYREFTQVGIELLGPDKPEYSIEVKELLKGCFDLFEIKYNFNDSVSRGWNYYLDQEGFEIEVEELDAQKQVAGGGKYKEGIGWAIGLERLLLAVERQSKNENT